jgi:hypothetical protein
MSIQEVSAEVRAQLFHTYHQALGADFAGNSNSSSESWDKLPQQEKNRVVAAARLTLMEIAASRKEQED